MPSVALLTGVRFVAADSHWLSPMYQRDTVVISFMTFETAGRPQAAAEFARYASALEVSSVLHSFNGFWYLWLHCFALVN